MALHIQKLKRSFILKKDNKTTELTDPNKDMAPEEVMKFYSGTYPELTNGVVEGPTVNGDKSTYTFVTKAGKLG